MSADRLRIENVPRMTDGRLILGFDGWMDGGDVSTGTVTWLIEHLDARRVGDIDPDGFYIFNFPGSMEIAAVFRPHARYEDGELAELDLPENALFCAPDAGIALFRGSEPNIGWHSFADCLFEFARQAGITEMTFIGSFAGAVPHTRDPRLFCSASDPELLTAMAEYGVQPTEYEGPAGFSTLLLHDAPLHEIQMMSLVAEIPAYVEGTNPKCIDTVIRKLAAYIGLPLPLDELRDWSTGWEERVTELIEEKTELAEHIEKLEENYDNEIFDTQMGDLKAWLQRQGIRVD